MIRLHSPKSIRNITAFKINKLSTFFNNQSIQSIQSFDQSMQISFWLMRFSISSLNFFTALVKTFPFLVVTYTVFRPLKDSICSIRVESKASTLPSSSQIGKTIDLMSTFYSLRALTSMDLAPIFRLSST